MKAYISCQYNSKIFKLTAQDKYFIKKEKKIADK